MCSDYEVIIYFMYVPCRLEKDLGTAVRNAEELQSCYEELRRKTKDKLKFVSTDEPDISTTW